MRPERTTRRPSSPCSLFVTSDKPTRITIRQLPLSRDRGLTSRPGLPRSNRLGSTSANYHSPGTTASQADPGHISDMEPLSNPTTVDRPTVDHDSDSPCLPPGVTHAVTRPLGPLPSALTRMGPSPGPAAPPPPGLPMPSPGRRGEPPQAPSQGWIFLPEHPGRPPHRHPDNSHSVGNRLDLLGSAQPQSTSDSAAPSKIKTALSARSGRLGHTRHPFHSVT